GVYYGRQFVDNMFQGTDDTLALTIQSLDTATESLELTKVTIGDVNAGLETVEEAALNISKTITDTRPLLDQVGVVVSHNAPQTLEAVQASIPNIAEVAGAIDQAMPTLSAFSINENFMGFSLDYNLGIDYAPPVPFDETFDDLGAGLEGLPEE